MGYLTSYKWKGVELNDGVKYSIPFADSSFDDRNSVDVSYAYRRDNLPVQIGTTIKEGVFALNITVIGESAADFNANLDTLKKLFQTTDRKVYKFERKLPHEQVYRYIEAAPREFSINRLERKVSITMHTTDKAWKAPAETTLTQPLFESAITEVWTVEYDGLTPVEPVLELTPSAPPGDGPDPRWSAEVKVYVVNPLDAIGKPIKITTDWDCSDKVTPPVGQPVKQRSDGLDISVTLPDGTVVPRVVLGTPAARDVWIKATRWRDFAGDVFLDGGFDASFTGYITLRNNTHAFVASQWPANSTVMIDDEIMSYSDAVIDFRNRGVLRIYITGRGVQGTTAAAHADQQFVKQETTLKIRYGYFPGREQVFPNDFNGWPLIDYDASTNKVWSLKELFAKAVPNVGIPPAYVTFFRSEVGPVKLPAGNYLYAGPLPNGSALTQKGRLYGIYKTVSPTTTVATTHQRLVWRYNPQASPPVVATRWKFTMKNEKVGAVTPMHLEIAQVLGQVGPTESKELIFAASRTASVNPDPGAAFDSGWVTSGSPLNTVVVDADRSPQPTNKDYVVIDEVQLEFLYRGSSAVGALQTEVGPETGVYYITVEVLNLSDEDNVQPFRMSFGAQIGDTLSVDCFNRTVTSDFEEQPLRRVSYTLPTWLRLVPGTNNLQFTNEESGGQVSGVIKYRSRY